MKTKEDMVPPQPTEHTDLRMHLVLADLKRLVPEPPAPKVQPRLVRSSS